MIIIILLFIFATCARFAVAVRSDIDYDSYGHLYFVKEIKRQKVGIFGGFVTNVVGSDVVTIPSLWHWIIGRLPLSVIVNFQKIVNPAIDAIFATSIYLICIKLELEQSNALLAYLLYLFTPMWFTNLSFGPRVDNLTPRLFSELMTNLFLIITILNFGGAYWVTVLMGTLICCLVLLSSKFGVQAMLFLVPPVALLLGLSAPFLSLLLSIVLCSIISSGKFYSSLKQQYEHLLWYFGKILQNRVPIADRNSFKVIFSLWAKESGVRKNLMLVFSRLVERNSFSGLVFKLPLVCFLIYIFAVEVFLGAHSIEKYFLVPVVVALAVFFIVSVRYFLFLGEAERYLNHVAFFIVLSSIYYAIHYDLEKLLYGIVGYGVLFWFAEVFFLAGVRNRLSPNRKKEEQKIINYLKSLPDEKVVLSYPYHAVGNFRIMLETKHKTVSSFMTTKEFSKIFNESYAASYPFIKLEKLDEMANSIGVDFLIVDVSKLHSSDVPNWSPSSSWTEVEELRGAYLVYYC